MLSNLGYSVSFASALLITVEIGMYISYFGWGVLGALSLTPVGWVVIGVSAVGMIAGLIFG